MVSQRPLYSRIYAVMADRIQSGEWAEGMRLPSEERLRDEFEASRGTVRQALALLRTEGLITGGRGAPPRVQRMVPSQPFDTYISFTEWAESMGREPSRKVIELSRKLADASSARALDVVEESPVVSVVAVRGFGDEPVMLERGVYITPLGEVLLEVDLESHSIYKTFRGQGVIPASSRNLIDAVAADEVDAHWLGVPVGSPLLRVRRTTSDQSGRIIDIADNRYLPAKATVVIDNAAAAPGGLSRQAGIGAEPSGRRV